MCCVTGRWNTTTVYTKVDLPRLAVVGAPWPEEVKR
jgi:hypothetical protein